MFAETVLATRGFRHSAVAVWNSLPDSICESSNIDILNIRLRHTYLTLHSSHSSGQSMSTSNIYWHVKYYTDLLTYALFLIRYLVNLKSIFNYFSISVHF